MSLGVGVIGDIYKLEERGTSIGIFSSAALIGLAISPFLGGAASQYWSWRNLHYSLAAWGLLEMLLIKLSLPETSHPGSMGIEKVKSRRRFHIPWVNPLSSLWLLRSPNLCAITFASSFVILTDYALLVPLSYTIGVRYGITNAAVIGACFLPNGLGNFSGSIGLTLNLLCLYTNGMGVALALNPIRAYNVDVMHSRSAEITAAYTAVRSLILSAVTALIIPSIERIGVGWTFNIAAILALVGQGMIFLTIRYGDRMRAIVDVGFSTIDSN
ncbi:hypothetical protein AZE42_10058 [Rhizopogon vesiculosus]|uniref:Major facilitator superfamily (MFS) profile domain-containing protein n=1 Tax=Rhizopogon vesiculosus TaxID=180088 RepID=A0A1J8QPR5_9AGAM|nr:hypothetical protein AZE42_10058 [Rhizopogon vesiculosus]